MSALRPAFFILYLESYISRLNEILCHDLTLSVSEPDKYNNLFPIHIYNVLSPVP